MRLQNSGRLLLLCLPLSLVMVLSASAQEEKSRDEKVKKAIAKAAKYLEIVQNPDGSFAPRRAGPGITALAVAGLLKNGYGVDDPVVAKALKFLEKNVQKDGGIYDKFLANYTTSVAVMALKEANKDGRYDDVLKKASKFLKSIQHDEPESLTTDVQYGGFGYDKKSRPDLSNTSFSVEAMIAAGVPKDDPALQKALKFISRCQNLPGETNDQAYAKKTTEDDRGGFTYDPTNPKESDYKTAAGGLRSVGGMTYSGLKSFLYAGVSKDDPRVKAALAWIRDHYTLKENPGMGASGLYYYYNTFAKAMDALGDETFVDAKGNKHQWRDELVDTILAKQNADGSWINKTDRRFGESIPELATAFAILSLSYADAPRQK